MSVTLDPRILLEVSDSLARFLNEVEFDQDVPEDIQKVLDGDSNRLTTSDLKWIKSSVPQDRKKDLYPLLKGSKLHLPELVFPERNPELEARCQKLRAEQEEREYRKMTRNVRKSYDPSEKTIAEQMKEINSYLMLLLQFLVSVATSFMFGYLAPYYFRGVTDVGTRLLIGVVIAFFVAVADMYFVIRQMLDDDGIRLAKKLD